MRRGATIRGMSGPIQESDWPAKCCAKCHFLAKRTGLTDRDTHWHVLTKSERTSLAAGSLDVGGEWMLVCYRGVWDHGYLSEDILDEFLPGPGAMTTRNRGEGCFFYPYTPTMFLPVARELEKRKVERRAAQQDRNVTREVADEDRKAAGTEAKKNRQLMLGALIVSALMLIASTTYFFFSLRGDRESDLPYVPVVNPSAPEKPAPAPTTPAAKVLPK